MLVQLPVCRLEELCAEIPAKLAPVHKLLKFGVRGSAELFFRFCKKIQVCKLVPGLRTWFSYDSKKRPATVLCQSSLSAISLVLCCRTCKGKLVHKEIQIYLYGHCCVKTVCLIWFELFKVMPFNLSLLDAGLSFFLPFEIIVLLNRVELFKLSNVDGHHCFQHLQK